ncbi:hypothetical protein PCAU_1732 [Pseudomonas chlororaphis subsp. aurantiaca]|uniref:hypothetical protein n=1 Tax=Pseudomonas chlororaphis TaxID=587753 RepID=UPI000864B32E|nr:hypothetical protein [Pseudomonas chlororaphis]BAV73941.1 hypothetical protein PCAU_1732 [Pseudomonas chlororaphis subsp. aurantiaca]
MPLYEIARNALSELEGVFSQFLDALHGFGLISSNYGSLLATLIAALVLFSIRELFNRAADYSGVYYTMSVVEDTSYNPFRGMRLFHTLVLFSDGYVVSGTSEKTGDVDGSRAHEYLGAAKIRGVVSGRVERNYIRSSVMHIHIVEQGASRESTSYMTIKVKRLNLRRRPFLGVFYSTAAAAKGRVQCGRRPFSEHPLGYLPFQSISESQSSD